eukprot:scaffold101922_cov17-Tisochrysis_lutea.AAC.2
MPACASQSGTLHLELISKRQACTYPSSIFDCTAWRSPSQLTSETESRMQSSGQATSTGNPQVPERPLFGSVHPSAASSSGATNTSLGSPAPGAFTVSKNLGIETNADFWRADPCIALNCRELKPCQPAIVLF